MQMKPITHDHTSDRDKQTAGRFSRTTFKMAPPILGQHFCHNLVFKYIHIYQVFKILLPCLCSFLGRVKLMGEGIDFYPINKNNYNNIDITLLQEK